MITNPWNKIKNCFKVAISKLSGADRRVILGEMAKVYGRGGQSFVAREFDAGRNTIRKGEEEYIQGKRVEDKFEKRGRTLTEKNLPQLVEDIKIVVEPWSQTDPKFRSTRMYTRLTIPKIRELLIAQRGYAEEDLPGNVTLNRIVNQSGYKLKRVLKVKPIKKLPETDMIFENLNKEHMKAKENPNIVRLSIDAKDKIKCGEFSRRGKSRVETKTYDHDFGDDYVTPFGILNVKTDESKIYVTKSNVTPDFMVDCIEDYWEKNVEKKRNKVLMINCDNGPECNSRRTQFIKRIIEFSVKWKVRIILAYYPPYHSKYNPIERLWGVLENYWNGSVLDSIDAVAGFARTMTWNGLNPSVSVVNENYDKGVKLSKAAMLLCEQALDRADQIGKWFLTITPKKASRTLKLLERL